MGAVILLLTLAPAQAAPEWILVPNHMADCRWAPATCLLQGGSRALIAGGYSYARGRCVASADRFDSARQVFVHCHGRLTYPRDFAQANLLPNGSVLITGGFNDVLASLDIAEIYDPHTDSFAPVKCHMTLARELFQGTTLSDGRVLLTGGLDLWIRRTTKTAEIYDPSTGQFTSTRGSMANDRFGHAACRLADGRVLVVGGTSWVIDHASCVLATAEIYDPKTDGFTPTKSDLLAARDRPTATLLPDGKVLITGGQGQDGAAVDFSEVFDPATEEFTRVACPQISARMAHGASALPDGRVVLAGGYSAKAHAATPSVEIFDPSSQSFSALPNLPFAALDCAQITFPDELTLVAGGRGANIGHAGVSLSSGAMLSL